MDLAALLAEWQRTESFMRCVTAWHVRPAQPARYRPLPAWMNEALRRSLAARGIEQLYTHQLAALEALRAGRHVLVTTPTASGKSLCYNLPVLNALCQQPATRALYLFPTKALSQDQVAELHTLGQTLQPAVQTYTYDGDTPVPMRQRIREAGQVVVTNPDMLHAAILPHHTKWLRLFENLRYVVVDEAHVYRGVFGSHVANVLRRLRRLCRFYGSRPQFILCSATVANPAELGWHLTGEDVVVVDESGAPQGERHTVLYNPPLIQPQLGLRRPSLSEARQLGTRLLRAGIPTLAFVKTRTQVELLTSYWRADLPERLRGRVTGYRGGYLPSERRQVERGLRTGELLGVVSTNALELGVDIGALDAVLTVGYPGSVASFHQQSGRAGRRQGLSLAMMIASAAPLDQYVVQHPEAWLHASPEAARLAPDNLLILTDHLKCAAYELPFTADEPFGVETTGDLLEYLADHRVLHRSRDGRYHWMADALPSHSVSLRSAAQDNVVIIDQSGARPQVIGEMDRFSALTALHEEAIYLHQARSYQVERLDLANGKAFVRRVEADYFTDAELAVRLQVFDVLAERQAGAWARLCTGELVVNAVPTLFKKIKWDTHENLGWGKIYLPEVELHTTGCWCEWPRTALRWDNDRWETALLGAAYALRHAVALHCMCSPADLYTAVEVKAPLTGRPTLYIYDAYPGGVGLAERAFRDADTVWATALAMICECPCEHGCPACIGPGRGTDQPKEWAAALLASLRTGAPASA